MESRFKPRDYLDLLKKSALSWDKDKAPMLAAAISYYTIFSIAPVLLIIVTTAGMLLGEEQVRREVVDRISFFVNPQIGNAVGALIERASEAATSATAIFSVIFLFWAATNVFKHLKNALNIVWGVKSPRRHWVVGQFLDRFFAFLMVLFIGFLLLTLLAVDAVMFGLSDLLLEFIPSDAVITLLRIANYLISFLVAVAFFAIIYKVMPDTNIHWKDVWAGAFLVAVMFTVLRSLISFYLGRSNITTIFGGASSFILVLIWIYYSIQLLLFGAEFTEQFCYIYGSRKGDREGPHPFYIPN